MTAKRRGGPSLWRNPDFLLLSGQGVSYLGNQVQNSDPPLIVLAITGPAARLPQSRGR